MVRKAKVSVASLAKAVGVSRQSVYSWISGRSVPRMRHVRLLASIIGVPSYQILRTFLNEDDE